MPRERYKQEFVRNPRTGNMVLADGAIGRKVLADRRRRKRRKIKPEYAKHPRHVNFKIPPPNHPFWDEVSLAQSLALPPDSDEDSDIKDAYKKHRAFTLLHHRGKQKRRNKHYPKPLVRYKY